MYTKNNCVPIVNPDRDHCKPVSCTSCNTCPSVSKGACRSGAPHVVCCGREEQRCMPSTICVSGLPACVCMPLQLIAIEQTCAQPEVCLRPQCRGPWPMVAEVTIPLKAWVCDAQGCTHCGEAEVTVCVNMPSSCCGQEGALLAAACIRLFETGAASCDARFCVRLQVSVEVYLVGVQQCRRPDPCACVFPQLPLYPQPQPYCCPR